MCGRYSLTSPLDDLVEVFEVSEVALQDYRPRFNIAPTQQAPVLVLGSSGLRLGSLRWGLVPFWAEDPRIGNRMINARSESVATMPAFRESFRARRCLVPATGFYEWMASGEAEPTSRKGKPRKDPFWIHRPDQAPFTFAGLWARWRSPEGERLHTFTILTTRANERLRTLHDRMPVVIRPEDRHTWLSPDTDPAALVALLAPAPDTFFEAWPVSRAVNSPDVDEPICVLPLVEEDESQAGGLVRPPFP
jgi:putative SOS response-associated peptidase YedK